MFQEILIKPVLTEKMAIMQERENKYAFIVRKSANKIQIKQAIENKFDVKVLKIATMNFDGKIKQMTTKSNGRTIRTEGKKSSFKHLNLQNFDFRICVEIPIKAKLNKMEYKCLPSYERERIGGKKKVNAIKDGLLILSEIVKYFFKVKK